MTPAAEAKVDELLRLLASEKPVPLARWAFPCAKCEREQRPGQPPVALGLYTAEGLVRHLEEVHGVKP